jgi:hypothetical protein
MQGKRNITMKNAIIALVAVTAAVVAFSRINRPAPPQGMPPHYGLQ